MIQAASSASQKLRRTIALVFISFLAMIILVGPEAIWHHTRLSATKPLQTIESVHSERFVRTLNDKADTLDCADCAVLRHHGPKSKAALMARLVTFGASARARWFPIEPPASPNDFRAGLLLLAVWATLIPLVATKINRTQKWVQLFTLHSYPVQISGSLRLRC